MDKTTINLYTKQMREQYQHLVSKKPDIGTGVQFYIDAMHQKNYFYDLLRKWIADFREIYDFISDEVNKGGTSFESNTFIQEATKLVDKYNQVYAEVSVIRDRKQKGNKTDLYEFFAWNYTIAFCDYIKDAFTPLIDNCRKDVSAQEPKARPRRPKGAPTPKPDYKALKSYFKDKVWFDTFLKPKLEAKSNKKRLAAIAYIIYEDRYLNKVPGTFTEWHTTFCRLLGCTAGQYYPNDIKDFQEYNALSKEFEKSTSDKHK